MLKSNEINNLIRPLIGKNEKNIYGSGIRPSVHLTFDEKKLEESKQKIADILMEIGIEDKDFIQLSSLTTLKNGEVWNELMTMTDFYALELLLACSDACGFINNSLDTIQTNIHNVGEPNSLILTSAGISHYGEGKWLELIRLSAIDKMCYFVNGDAIKKYASNSEPTIKPTQLHI